MEELIKLKCILGYCKGGAIILPNDVIEVVLITDDGDMKVDVEIMLIESKFTSGLETSISGEDLVKHFVYND